MTTRNRWPTLRVMLTAHGTYVLVLWLVLAVISVLITIGIAMFGNVENSVWHYMGTQVSRWIMLGIGADAVSTYLRLHLAHGRTRADFLRQLWPYLGALSIVVGLFVAIGYLVENGAYAIAGWPQRLPDGMLFNAATEFASIAGVYMIVFVLWTLAGVLLSAAFARNFLLGVVTVPLAVLVVIPADVLMTVNGIPAIGWFTAELDLPLLASLGVVVLAAGVGAVAIWGITRDFPLRPRVA